MNKDIILSTVKPYLNSLKEILYDDFKNLFSFLENNEQLELFDFLEENGISLVDKKNVNNNFEGELSSENVERSLEVAEQHFDKDSLYASIKDSNERLVTVYQSTGYNYYLNLLIKKNIRFIKKQAYKLANYYNHKFDEDDLLQIAIIGFIKGCQRYNMTQGYSLLTYVTFWMKQVLHREIINEGFLVRLPIHVWEDLRKILKLTATHPEEDIHDILKSENISQERYENILKFQQQYLSTASLDAQISGCENLELIDSISKENFCLISRYEDCEKKLEEDYLKDLFNKLFRTLSQKERDIIMLRFGLEDKDNKTKTLEEIGNIYGVTRERIRQIENRAIHKLSKLLKTKRYNEDAFLEQFKSKIKINFDKKYYFKKNELSYIPKISEMIKRVKELYPIENDIEFLYNELKKCASQNGYNSDEIDKSYIIDKIKFYKEQV